ncbi:hypothetical protein V3W47_18945 [Deinococcus sp. YIM 134068]|uniref:hypothetical protein n=1 Tax=Deinococcus lichenicola TaxID=3118910 RepID=UPI002F9237E3
MHPRAPLALLLTLSAASAAPLLGSRGSVAEGGFCQTYGCDLIRREVIAPDLLDNVSYDYRLRGGGGVVVVRNHERRVESALLYGTPFTGNLARDFTRTFAGVAFEPSSVRRCMSRASDAGELLASGAVLNRAYQVVCYRIGGRSLLAVEMKTDSPVF